MTRAQRPWTEADMQQLRELAPSMSYAAIALQMGRPVKAVQAQALRQGLRKRASPQRSPRLVPITQPMRVLQADGRVRQQQAMTTVMLPGSSIGLRAQWDQLAPAHVPVTVVPAQGKAAGYDPRYSHAPGEQVFGCGFAAAGPGIDVTTGRAW